MINRREFSWGLAMAAGASIAGRVRTGTHGRAARSSNSCSAPLSATGSMLNHKRRPGAAALTDSIGVVLRCANPYGMPAANAARATARSPSGWNACASSSPSPAT
jgi:hypothetical protein